MEGEREAKRREARGREKIGKILEKQYLQTLITKEFSCTDKYKVTQNLHNITL